MDTLKVSASLACQPLKGSEKLRNADVTGCLVSFIFILNFLKLKTKLSLLKLFLVEGTSTEVILPAECFILLLCDL